MGGGGTALPVFKEAYASLPSGDYLKVDIRGNLVGELATE